MTLETKAIGLPHANVDTDQLIPARFLKHPRSVDHGQFLLHDLRWDEAGRRAATRWTTQAAAELRR